MWMAMVASAFSGSSDNDETSYQAINQNYGGIKFGEKSKAMLYIILVIVALLIVGVVA